MAIRLSAHKTETLLFCSSKFWGNPDLPPQVEYPTMTVTEDGESYDYPLTFVCQIDCEDIAALDPEGKLPHEGMLYFFAAIDELLGYGSPEPLTLGNLPKKMVVVKYAKQINMETFNSCILVDEDNQEIAGESLAIDFSSCADSESCIRLLGSGTAAFEADCPESSPVLQLANDAAAGIQLPDGAEFSFALKDSDLKFGNWKRTFGHLVAENE